MAQGQKDTGRAAGAARTVVRIGVDDDGLGGGGGNADKSRNDSTRKQCSFEFDINHVAAQFNCLNISPRTEPRGQFASITFIMVRQ
jgi:hypothetical protein